MNTNSLASTSCEEIRSLPKSESPNLWKTARNTFNASTKGYEAKVINVVGYVLLQIVLDLTVFQMMLRYAVSAWRGELASLDMDQEIEPTPERVQILGIIFFTTLVGSVIAVYKNAIGPILLILTQIAMAALACYYISMPLILEAFQEVWIEKKNNICLIHMCYHIFIALFYCSIYFFPTFINLWYMYCTFMVMLVLLGFKVFEDKKTNAANSVSVSSDLASMISPSEGSSPPETGYYGDNSSFSE
ncbi:hypothetical protein GCK72_023003 [Caenorhabditis remanei]|uniref:Uncharacterized protein n=1 Tax=Caenorhabditis remanei TaxID=31234 RepID=A0A6A5FVI8_CAERE|nr:hypothetical protein GCK72_023003 [Caenorhabditis remanei]KAF1746546.1 hypothetical protein GCK72_023003 [Caenorhabditis remanei]